MKREILFKAKHYRSNIWYFGFYWFNEFTKEHFLKCLTEGGTQYEDIKVNPETVCQFTGLLDKNGNKIFEGDKLNYTITPINGKTTIIPYLVVFNVDGFQVLNLIKKFKASYIDELFYRAPKRMTYKDWSKCEIIGNIYD